MYSILLVIIYVSFISLGLPDSLLGSAWPSMYGGLGVSISAAGVISMIIAGGTILSSLLSAKLIRRLGTGRVTAVSVGMTAAALFGFSISHSFPALCLWAIPYGLGAGSVDAALNNFVALRYKARHMSWLHCFWGVGASVGPYIMGWCLAGGGGWNSGYRTISIIQIALTAVLLCTLPLWREKGRAEAVGEESTKSLSLREVLRLTGAKPVLAAFFCYCALEQTTALWGGSYMVVARGVAPETAAEWSSIFFLGITAGRFICGFITMKLGDKRMVRLGQLTAALGIAALLLPLGNAGLCVGLALIGLGCAPIYPSLLHATPGYFGAEASQSLMGVQMASAYVGSTFAPPLVGLLAERVSMTLFPVVLALVLLLMAVMSERKNRVGHST